MVILKDKSRMMKWSEDMWRWKMRTEDTLGRTSCKIQIMLRIVAVVSMLMGK